jgi:hypothetical protein
VVVVRGEDVLERRLHGGGLGVGDAVAGPVVPWPQVHQRLGVERPRVEVIGEGKGYLPHRLGIGVVGGLAVFGAAGVARRQGVDIGPFTLRRGCLHRHRLLRQLAGARLVGGIHGRIDVRSQHQSLAPVGHGQRRVEAPGFGEGAAGLGVIEAVGEVQALVDEQLCLGIRRAHRERVDAEVLEPRGQGLAWDGRLVVSGRRVVMLVLGHRRGGLGRRLPGGASGQGSDERQGYRDRA